MLPTRSRGNKIAIHIAAILEVIRHVTAPIHISLLTTDGRGGLRRWFTSSVALLPRHYDDGDDDTANDDNDEQSTDDGNDNDNDLVTT